MVTIRRELAETVARGRGVDSLNVFVPPEWTLDAACAEVGPDLFFPEDDGEHGGKGSGYARLAKQVCALCPVVEECLEYALAYESGAMGTLTSYGVVGVYGGKSPRDRIKMLRERAAS